jgi:hypothetical protein
MEMELKARELKETKRKRKRNGKNGANEQNVHITQTARINSFVSFRFDSSNLA